MNFFLKKLFFLHLSVSLDGFYSLYSRKKETKQHFFAWCWVDKFVPLQHEDVFQITIVVMSQSPDKQQFIADVYNIVSQIPCGKVLTYGAIARLAGWPNHSRMVGWALRTVGSSLMIPCHRVVNSQGRMAPMWAEQAEMLRNEGVVFRKHPHDNCVDLSSSLWHPED